MEISFTGGTYQTFSRSLNPQECINFYPVVDKTGGRSPLALRGTPGLLEWLDLGQDNEIRNVKQVGRYTYWVCGKNVFKVDTDKNKTTCSNELETESGYVWIESNNADQIMIVDKLFGYTIDDDVITRITDTDFPDRPTSLAFQDGYFIITYEESGRIYISDLNDGTSWDGTAYGNAEARPDDSLSLISDHDMLIVLGEKTKQSFQNTGATFPFVKISGSTQSVGINAPDSLTQFTNTFFWLSDFLQFVQSVGQTTSFISNQAIEYQINKMSTTNDCVSFGYVQDGTPFLVNQFKSENQTWVYDLSSGFWHRRISYPGNSRWRANCYSYFACKHLVGDYENGKIYELDFDTFTDDGNTIHRKRICPPIHAEGKNVFHYQLEIFFEPGVGISSGQGSDPMAMLRYSDDGGHIWSNEIWRSVGKIGKYKWRAVWDRLGSARNRVYELTVSDPVQWVVIGANLNAETGVS